MAKYKTQIIPPPVRGLDTKTEAVMLNPIYSPNLQNVLVSPTKIKKDLGYTTIGSNLPLDGIGMELIQFTDGIGAQHLIACTSTAIYVYDSSSDRWRILNLSLVIEDCEDAWAAVTAASADAQATVSKVGTNAVKIILDPGDYSIGDRLAVEAIAETDLSGYTTLGCWIQSTIAIPVGHLQFALCEDAAGVKTNDYAVTTNDAALVADTWYFLQMPITLDDIDEAESIGLYLNDDTTFDVGCTIYLDDVKVFSAFTGGASDRWTHAVINDANEGWQNATALLLSNNTSDGAYTWDGQTKKQSCCFGYCN